MVADSLVTLVQTGDGPGEAFDGPTLIVGPLNLVDIGEIAGVRARQAEQIADDLPLAQIVVAEAHLRILDSSVVIRRLRPGHRGHSSMRNAECRMQNKRQEACWIFILHSPFCILHSYRLTASSVTSSLRSWRATRNSRSRRRRLAGRRRRPCAAAGPERARVCRPSRLRPETTGPGRRSSARSGRPVANRPPAEGRSYGAPRPARSASQPARCVAEIGGAGDRKRTHQFALTHLKQTAIADGQSLPTRFLDHQPKERRKGPLVQSRFKIPRHILRWPAPSAS